jgi:hypothetical protein
MTRRTLSGLLAVGLLFGLTGCSGDVVVTPQVPALSAADAVVTFFPTTLTQSVQSMAALGGLQFEIIGGQPYGANESFTLAQSVRMEAEGDLLEFRSDVTFDAATGDTQMASVSKEDGEVDWTSTSWFSGDTLYHQTDRGRLYRWQDVTGHGAAAPQRLDIVMGSGGIWQRPETWNDAAAALANEWKTYPDTAFTAADGTVKLYTNVETPARGYTMTLTGASAEAQAQAVFSLLGDEPTYGVYLRELADAVPTGASDSSLVLRINVIGSTPAGLDVEFTAGDVALNFNTVVYVDGFASHREVALGGAGTSFYGLVSNGPNGTGGYRLTVLQSLSTTITVEGAISDFTAELMIAGDGTSTADTPLNHEVQIDYSVSAPKAGYAESAAISGNAHLTQSVTETTSSLVVDAPAMSVTIDGEKTLMVIQARVDREKVSQVVVTPPEFITGSSRDISDLAALFDARGIDISPDEYVTMPPEVRFAMVVFAS